MIPRDYVTRWRAHAPWAIDAQVEQDLVISRALVELFRSSTRIIVGCRCDHESRPLSARRACTG